MVAVVMLTISPIAHADPVHMACSGQMLLSSKRVDTDAVLSITVDMIAEKVTVGANEPVSFLPPIPGTENNEVHFIGATTHGGVLHGHVDRITGETTVVFWANTPKEEFFSGNCRPAKKLF